MKIRDSDFDPNLREFSITDHGIVIGGIFEGAEQVLSGFARPPHRGPPLRAGGHMTTVLVVDDEPLIAMALQAALEDEKYRVLTAANGKQGLERLAETRADIVSWT